MIQRPFFFFFPFLSFFSPSLRRLRSQQFSKHTLRFTNLATLGRERRDSYRFLSAFYRVSSADFPAKWRKRSHRSPKFFSIIKKLERNKFDSRTTHDIYIIPRNLDFHSQIRSKYAKKYSSRTRELEFRNTYRPGFQRRLLRPGNWNKNENPRLTDSCLLCELASFSSRVK